MDIYVDAAFESLNHHGEELCGDKVEFVRQDNSFVAVLADGLGSGVKANILSTLTSKIIATMLLGGARLTDAIETIANTLPVCSERAIAYSTFTIIRVMPDGMCTIAEFDNPFVTIFRNNKLIELEKTTEAMVQTKKLLDGLHQSLTKHFCRECGYNSDEIFWRCPQCHQWETIQFRWKV